MDIYHFGKEDLKDDHKVVHERLLEVAIPDDKEAGETVTLEECLENYFNNRIEVKRLLHRRNTLQSLRAPSIDKGQVLHIETAEVPSRSASPASVWTPISPSVQTPTSPTRPMSARHRTDSIFSEKHKSQDDASVKSGRPRAGTIRKEVLMPAWQFFSLIPWYTEDNPTNDAQVAAHFQTKRPVLGICLKRYKVDDKGVSSRLNTHVDIPLEIALPEFVSDEHVQEDFGDFKLSLESVVCHRGHSTDAGHYISLIRGAPPNATSAAEISETPWMRFDDLAQERVSFVDIKTALKEESPYLLFYQVQPIEDDLPPTYEEAKAEGQAPNPLTTTDSPSIVPTSVNDSRTTLSASDTPPSTVTDSTNPSRPTTEILVTTPTTSSDEQPPKARSTTDVTDFVQPSLPTGSSTISTAAGSMVDLPVTTASVSAPAVGTTSPRVPDSTDSMRRSSVTFDTTSISGPGTATPSVAGSVKTPLTAPTTPSADEANRNSWIPNMSMSSLTGITSRSASRRNSRGEKTLAGKKSSDLERIGGSSATATPEKSAEKKDRSRPPSQSGEGRLGFTMSRLTGRMSKDKLFGPADSVVEGETAPVAAIKVAEVSEERNPRKSRASLDLLSGLNGFGGSPKEKDSSTLSVGNTGSIGRSKSLRVRGHRHGLSLGGNEDKKEKKARSVSRNRLSMGPKSMEELGKVEYLPDPKEKGKAKMPGSAAVEETGSKKRPDRECIVM